MSEPYFPQSHQRYAGAEYRVPVLIYLSAYERHLFLTLSHLALELFTLTVDEKEMYRLSAK